MLSWWLKKVCSGTLALCLEYILSFYSHPDDYSISLSIRCALKVLSEYPEAKMTDEQQKKALGETYSQLVNRLDEGQYLLICWFCCFDCKNKSIVFQRLGYISRLAITPNRLSYNSNNPLFSKLSSLNALRIISKVTCVNEMQWFVIV